MSEKNKKSKAAAPKHKKPELKVAPQLTNGEEAANKQGANLDWAGQRGRKPGQVNKTTIEAKKKMEELGFDPLEMSVAIARGEALTKNHPFLEELTRRLQTIAFFVPEDNEELVANLIKRANITLRDSWTPLDLRSQHVRELLNYIYPKRRSTEIDTPLSGGPVEVTPLTKKEVKLFRKKFDRRYGA